MYVIVWSYRVREGMTSEFERHYGPAGTWAAFFRQDQGYQRTELLRGPAEARVYWTVDYWRSEEDLRRFMEQHRDRYASLDSELEQLTENEGRLGAFEVVV